MPEHTLFHIVFLSQVLLISLYYPRAILGRMRRVFKTHPPSEYPKLYPKPTEHYERTQRNYGIANHLILFGGVVVWVVLLFTERSGEWDHVFAAWFFFVQFVPVMLLDLSSLREFRLMRNANSRTTRVAQLTPRRLFDFVSPTMVGLAIFTYVVFIVFIVYVDQFGFAWFGGYTNIAVATAMNLMFAGVVLKYLYGRNQNPLQAYEDRIRRIEVVSKTMLFLSIGATLFIMLSITLAALDARDLQPIAQSLYFQLLAVASFQSYRIDDTNFDAYKDDPLTTGRAAR